MKRILLVFLLIFSIALSSCGAELFAIEDFEWKMRTVMSVDATQSSNDFVIAVGEPDSAHPNAKTVELTLSAKDGVLTLSDITNGKTYGGTYKVKAKTPKSIDYEIVIDGVSGYATVAATEYYDGSRIPTLPVSLGEYSFYFIPNE